MAVGMGLTRSQDSAGDRCFTDGSGPEVKKIFQSLKIFQRLKHFGQVFQQCAPRWVDERTQSRDNYGKFERIQNKCSRRKPPSYSDEICRSFHQKIKKIQ